MRLGIFGWIVLGFARRRDLRRARRRRARRAGCLPNIVVGILGGVVGGWLAQQMGFTQVNGFIAPSWSSRCSGSLVVRLVASASANAATDVARRAAPANRPRLPSGHDRSPPADAPTAAETRRPAGPTPRASRASSPARPACPTSTGSAAACSTAATASATSSSTARIRRSRTCCGPATGIRAHHLATQPVPAGRARGPPRAARPTTKPMDALRTAVSAWGATQELPWPPTVEQARALTAFAPSALAAFARLRAGAGTRRARPVARPRSGFPLPADRREARRRHGAGTRCVLHRRRRAWLQRLDVHRAGHHLDPLGHRLGGVRRRSGR